MRRRLLPILAAIRLALWLAVAGVFVRSFWVADVWMRSLTYGADEKATIVASSDGRLDCRLQWTYDQSLARGRRMFQNKALWQYGRAPLPQHRLDWYKLLVPSWHQVASASASSTYGRTDIFLPYWPILLVLAIPPALWLRRFRRARRQQRWQRLGLCPECGYDLRAHAAGQLCPECGKRVPEDLVRKPIG